MFRPRHLCPSNLPKHSTIMNNLLNEIINLISRIQKQLIG